MFYLILVIRDIYFTKHNIKYTWIIRKVPCPTHLDTYTINHQDATLPWSLSHCQPWLRNTAGCMSREDLPNTPTGNAQFENSEVWSSWNAHLFYISKQSAEWIGPSSSSRQIHSKAKVSPLWSTSRKEPLARPMWHHSIDCVLSAWPGVKV